MKTELWERLHAARTKGPRAPVSQSEIAAACVAEIGKKLTRNAVTLWESENPENRTQPNLLQLKVFSEETGVDLLWIITDSESLDPKPISSGEATLGQSVLPRSRRVLIRGSAVVDKEGFWKELDESAAEQSPGNVLTDDPDAYAIRILGRRYNPKIAPGQCILIEPSRALKAAATVLVQMADGRYAVRSFLTHQNGYWTFMSVLDSNDILELTDAEVASVHRITNVFDTD